MSNNRHMRIRRWSGIQWLHVKSDDGDIRVYDFYHAGSPNCRQYQIETTETGYFLIVVALSHHAGIL
jgi:hypothetical protein